jgi:predicted cupin superfamily sugar epimerase
MKVADFVERLRMQEHPEGGYYAEIYRNNTVIASEILGNRYSGERSLASIYLQAGRLPSIQTHRLKSDDYGIIILVRRFCEYIFGRNL